MPTASVYVTMLSRTSAAIGDRVEDPNVTDVPSVGSTYASTTCVNAFDTAPASAENRAADFA